jgi:hypothetical protein
VWASSPAIATKQQNSLIWATIVMNAPDVIAVHIGGYTRAAASASRDFK